MDNVYTQFKGNNPFASQAKMLFHGDTLATYLKTGDCHPVFCEVNLTDRCNLRCQWCISENFKCADRELPERVMKDFARDFQQFGGRAITFSGGGEPTLHSAFRACVEHCRSLGIELGLMTNGAYSAELNPVIANSMQWVRVSLDTIDRAHYKRWKGVDRLDQVLANIRTLTEAGSARVGINCNVHKNLTIREVDDLINLLDDYQVNYLQFRPVIPRYYKGEVIELNQRVWSYLATVQDGRISYSYDKFNDLSGNVAFPFDTCEAHRVSCVVDSNGDLCPCMYHPQDSRFVFGSLLTDELPTIWASQRRQVVLQFMRHGLNMQKECQVCCKLCELNKLFQFLKTPNLDINFL